MNNDSPGHLIARRQAGDLSVTIQEIEEACMSMFSADNKVEKIHFMDRDPESGVRYPRFNVTFTNGAVYTVYYEGGAL